MKSKKNLVLATVAVAISCWQVPVCFALGDQATPLGLAVPKFVPLEIGEESFSFAITDENTTTELEAVSFWGSTAVSGICREDNDSVTAIHLAYTQKLKILEQDYKSARYPGKELCVIEKTNVDGTVTTSLLMPAKLVVCGIEKKSKDEKAWFVGKIDQLVRLGSKPVEHSDIAITKHINHLEQQAVTPDIKVHKRSIKRPHDPAAKRVLEVEDQPAAPKVVVLEKQTGAMESKTILRSLNDLAVAIIGVVKALFEFVRGLFF